MPTHQLLLEDPRDEIQLGGGLSSLGAAMDDVAEVQHEIEGWLGGA
jgi:hypothetical protein